MADKVVTVSAGDAIRIGQLDAHGQADLVRGGQLTSRELVEAALVRIDLLDTDVNAVTFRAEASARSRADAAGVPAAGSLSGVPYLLKSSLEYPDFPQTAGSRARAGAVGKSAFAYAKVLDTAGLIPVGMSSMPEFGLLPTAETALTGATRNPWNLDRIAGGSSSGAAAAVAAGIVPLAHASDAGGSIRLPASCTGIVGFKPSRGANVRARAHHLIDDVLCSDSLYSRSVRDVAWGMELARPQGTGTGAGTAIPLAPVSRGRRLRIGLDLHGLSGALPEAEVIQAIEKTAALCADLGHSVEATRMPIDGPGVVRTFQVLWAYLGGDVVDIYTGRYPGVPPADLLEPWTLGLADKRAPMQPDDVMFALETLVDTRRRLGATYERFDAILSPVVSQRVPAIGRLGPNRSFDALWDDLFGYLEYTTLHNLTGAPSVSLPLFADADGLPIGSMFSAAPGQDVALVELSFELEAAKPWADRWPALTLAAAKRG